MDDQQVYYEGTPPVPGTQPHVWQPTMEHQYRCEDCGGFSGSRVPPPEVRTCPGPIAVGVRP